MATASHQETRIKSVVDPFECEVISIRVGETAWATTQNEQSPQSDRSPDSERSFTMKTRPLGSTGLDVSVIGLGTWQFGGEWGRDYAQADVNDIVAAARDAGMNLLDTAECYGDHLSESLIGPAIEQDRDRWIVATKFGHRYKGFLDRDLDFSPDGVRKQLEESLRVLRTDVIDIYQFHSGDNERFDSDELWAMLDAQRKAGKIRFLGVSLSASNETIHRHQTERAAQVGASVIQVVYNRLDRGAEQQVFPTCREQNLGVLARVPLASGLLSGKYRAGCTFADNDVRATRDPVDLGRRIQEVEQVASEEVPEGVPMAQWALAWCLNDPVVTSVIPGCKNVAQVQQNAAATEF